MCPLSYSMPLLCKCLRPAVAALVVVVSSAAAAVEKEEITLEYVARLAEARSQEVFKDLRGSLPPELSVESLNYDRYRELRFNPEQALWRKDERPFWVEFFHPGYIYQEPVQMHEFTAEGYTQPIRFAPDFFDYSRVTGLREKIPAEAGYAGFKLLHALNEPGRMDELAVFQGASYFRLLGRGSRYGQSARGLALNCGEGEEFPLFTHFWLGKPQPGVQHVTLFALLDSRSCTGAYRFVLKPGQWSAAEVDAVLFFRAEALVRAACDAQKVPYVPLKTTGLAPLTSMFWFGENTEGKPDDYRAEVHDSDGLLIRMENDEIVWRPLNNPPQHHLIRHSVFAANNPKAFGLLQRDREYLNYHEVTNLYHRTPSVIIRPKGQWGEGQVRLVEIGTVSEYEDNIVAFWNPAQLPKPGEPFRFGYTLESGTGGEESLSPNFVQGTRFGADPANPKVRDIVIDFAGDFATKIPETDPPVAVPSCPEGMGHFSKAVVLKNDFEKAWRVFLKFEPAPGLKDPVPLRCTLKKGDTVLTETWDYLWNPR